MLEPSRLILRLVVAPLLLLLLICPETESARQACKRLTDNTSPFVEAVKRLSAIGGLAPVTYDASAFAPLERALPTLSTCLAQINPVVLISSLLSSSPQALRCWTDLTVSTDAETIGDGETTVFGTVVCPTVEKLSPCYFDVLLPAVDAALATTNGCCDPFLEQVQLVFGAPFKPAMTTLVRAIGNALCSKRQASGSTEVDVCGDILVKNWVTRIVGDDDEELTSLVDSFQIPNDQLCQAARNEAYVTTMNTTQRFGGDNRIPYGVCAQPMDELVQYVHELPYWNSSDDAAVVDKIFTDKSCLPGRNFLPWASNEGGSFKKGAQALDAMVNTVAILLGENQPPLASPTPTPVVTRAQPLTSQQSSGESSGSDDGMSDLRSKGSSDSGSNGSDGSSESSSSSNGRGSGESSERGSESASNDGDAPGVFDSLTDDGVDTLAVFFAINVSEIVQSTLSRLEPLAADFCLHIPSGVTCNFPGEKLTLPFPEVALTSATTEAPSPQPTATIPKPAMNGGGASVSEGATTTTTTNSTNSTSGDSYSVGIHRHQSVVFFTLVCTLVAVALEFCDV